MMSEWQSVQETSVCTEALYAAASTWRDMPGNFPKGLSGRFDPPGVTLDAFSAGGHPRIAGSPWQSRHCPLSSAKAAPANNGRIARASATSRPNIAVKKDRSVRLRGIAIASTPCSMSRIAESRGVAVFYVDCIHTASIRTESREKYRPVRGRAPAH